MVSILMLTIDRFNITRDCLEHNLETVGPYELLVADNGSVDNRVVAYIDMQNPAYHRINKKNEGVSKGFNQLYLRSRGSYIAILGNDIMMPNGWFQFAKNLLDKVPNAGIAGFDWGHGSVPPLSMKYGVEAHFLTPELNRVFGSWVIKRELVEKLGLFHDGFDVYGIEDTDFNERVNRAGFHSFYVPYMKSRHMINDVGENTEYRKTKDTAIQVNCGIYNERLKGWESGATLVEPLPEMREPLI